MVLGNFQICLSVVVFGLGFAWAVSAPAQPSSNSPLPQEVQSDRDADADADMRVMRTIGQFDADAALDPAFAGILVERLGLEYQTPVAEFRWAGDRMLNGGSDESFGWGDVAVLAYLQATTGWSFSDLVEAGAHNDLSSFVDTMEMSHSRMAASLDTLAQRVVRERNSIIFDRIRSAPRPGGLEDLGAGFGLFQESLDFRQLDPPGPTKVHDAGGPGIVFQVGAQ